MAPLSPRKTAVAAGVTEQGTAVLERAAQVLALGGRFSAWKMLVQVNAADTCISARYIFCWSNSKDECLDPRLRPARLDKPIYVDACLYENLSSYDVLILFFHIKIYLKILLKNTTFVPYHMIRRCQNFVRILFNWPIQVEIQNTNEGMILDTVHLFIIVPYSKD